MVALPNKRRWPPGSNTPGLVTKRSPPPRRPHASRCCYTAVNLICIFKCKFWVQIRFSTQLFLRLINNFLATPQNSDANSWQRLQLNKIVLDNGNGVRQSRQISEKGAECFCVVPVCQSDDRVCGSRLFLTGLLSLSKARLHRRPHAH